MQVGLILVALAGRGGLGCRELRNWLYCCCELFSRSRGWLWLWRSAVEEMRTTKLSGINAGSRILDWRMAKVE